MTLAVLRKLSRWGLVPSFAFGCLILAGSLSGCASEGPTDPGYRSIATHGRTAVDPVSEMLAVGCRLTGAASEPTTVRLIPRQGRPDLFDCEGVAADSVSLGVNRYISANMAAEGGAFLVAGRWAPIMREFCYATRGWWQADGTYWLDGGRLYDCFIVSSWTFIRDDSPFGENDEWPIVPIDPNGGTSGGGPEGLPSDPVPPGPCPASDPKCWVKMTPTEVTSLQTMTNSAFANESDITDPQALAVCRETKAAIAAAFGRQLAGEGEDMFWRGKYDQDAPDPGHSGQATGGRLHVDPFIWKAATTSGPDQTAWQRALAELLMHEIRHTSLFDGERHPHADSLLAHGTPQPQTPAEVAALYANDPPFNLINSNTPGQMCVRPH